MTFVFVLAAVRVEFHWSECGRLGKTTSMVYIYCAYINIYVYTFSLQSAKLSFGDIDRYSGSLELTSQNNFRVN